MDPQKNNLRNSKGAYVCLYYIIITGAAIFLCFLSHPVPPMKFLPPQDLFHCSSVCAEARIFSTNLRQTLERLSSPDVKWRKESICFPLPAEPARYDSLPLYKLLYSLFICCHEWESAKWLLKAVYNSHSMWPGCKLFLFLKWISRVSTFILKHLSRAASFADENHRHA